MASQNVCGMSCNICIIMELMLSNVPDGQVLLFCADCHFLGLRAYLCVGDCSGTVAISGNIVYLPLYFEGPSGGALSGGITC